MKNQKASFNYKPIILSAILGSLSGISMLYSGFTENHQLEYYIPGKGIDYLYSLKMFSFAFILVFLASLPFSVFLTIFVKRKK